MVKKILLAGILFLFMISYISAFCTTQGYVLDNNKEPVNASKIDIICKRASGDIIAQIRDIPGYGFPFGDWYDDCSYCDLGVHVIVFDDRLNLFGEYYNKTCSSDITKKCHTDIYVQQISEPVSSKQGYDTVPDVGPYAPEPKPMPKSEETPKTNIPGIKEDFDYGYVYYIIGIVLIIAIIIFIRKKYAK